MAFTYPGSPTSGNPIRTSGRGFASVDPERQREVVGNPRLSLREPQGSTRSRRAAAPEWFSPPRPADEGGSSRRAR